MSAQPPEGHYRYRAITGTSEEELAAKVDEALRAGFELWAGPSVSANAGTLVLVQAVRWPVGDTAS